MQFPLCTNITVALKCLNFNPKHADMLLQGTNMFNKFSCVRGLSYYTQTTKHNGVSQIKDTDTCMFSRSFIYKCI